jgi:hypothetical protein
MMEGVSSMLLCLSSDFLVLILDQNTTFHVAGGPGGRSMGQGSPESATVVVKQNSKHSVVSCQSSIVTQKE